MEQSNSGMMGHGMPNSTTNYSTTKQKKTKKSKKRSTENATMYKVSENESMFAMVKTDNGIIICCGKYRISNKTFKSYKEAETFIASKPYELIINVSVLFTKLNNDENKKQNLDEGKKNA